MYLLRRVTIGQTAQLDELARECGKLYSQTVVFFWRTVRHKGIWLAPKHLMRLFTSDKLHAHTSDACVQSFFAALKSWRKRRKSSVQGRHFRCGQCGFQAHRDMVGAMNIRYKYREEFGVPHVVAVMAPATGIRFRPHACVAREQLRENVCVGNCTEAAGL